MNRALRLIGRVEWVSDQGVQLGVGTEGEPERLFLEDLEGWEPVGQRKEQATPFADLISEITNVSE